MTRIYISVFDLNSSFVRGSKLDHNPADVLNFSGSDDTYENRFRKWQTFATKLPKFIFNILIVALFSFHGVLSVNNWKKCSVLGGLLGVVFKEVFFFYRRATIVALAENKHGLSHYFMFS